MSFYYRKKISENTKPSLEKEGPQSAKYLPYNSLGKNHKSITRPFISFLVTIIRYNSVNRNLLYEILSELQILENIVSFIQMTVPKTKSRICISGNLRGTSKYSVVCDKRCLFQYAF
ncbi:hypothetical protein CWI39_2338p0010 [Hamiltosporidium magnivora]|uniref:Uncharacterized protein n=1 Tax=Hamiltosporidium magnivora TaxID=148818 RepID=A0A4V2JU41_9MICR|nr:hypothetical protein CWI39_2338p0010 [Hamiltosporidium magnivora]